MIRAALKFASVGITTIINDSLAIVGRAPRRAGMSPNFVAPYGKLSQQSIDRLAAAQSKRDRRAAKKGTK